MVPSLRLLHLCRTYIQYVCNVCFYGFVACPILTFLFTLFINIAAAAPVASVMDYYVARVGWWQDGSVMVQVRTYFL